MRAAGMHKQASQADAHMGKALAYAACTVLAILRFAMYVEAKYQQTKHYMLSCRLYPTAFHGSLQVNKVTHG